MPLFEYVCGQGHLTERLLRGMIADASHMPCGVCGEVASRKLGRIAATQGRVNSQERLSNYHEAAQEMQYRHDHSDDPGIKAANPPRIWHAAKVRAEAQMMMGATRWTPDKPWNHKEAE